MTDPTRIDGGQPEVKAIQRPMAAIVIQLDPNSGDVKVQVTGLSGPVEEMGLFEYAKGLRMAHFIRAANPHTSAIVIPPAGTRIKN